MTKAVNESTKSTDHIELINRYQEMFNRQVEQAFQVGEMDEDTYREFMSEACTSDNVDDIYNHFYNLFTQLVEYHQGRLSERIIKGAEFIESIGKDDPKYEAAMRKYDALCSMLQESMERGREHRYQRAGCHPQDT
ncbi:hypothetical protein [Paenibacillus apiarius]|uniref:hypothetical protein n=1 Tax=Paenibacillus apiarius TaxID=46240 RepID=UPI003B3A4F54